MTLPCPDLVHEGDIFRQCPCVPQRGRGAGGGLLCESRAREHCLKLQKGFSPRTGKLPNFAIPKPSNLTYVLLRLKNNLSFSV